MAIRRVETPTKADAAYVALREAIRSGELAPGQRVTLHELAGDLQMSLTPVREALRKLAVQGMVEHRANYGTVVTEYTRENAEEIFRLRKVLEPMAVELAATAATEEDLSAIATAMREFDDVVGGSDTDLVERNYRVHHAMYEAARSKYLLEFIDRLWHGVPFQAILISDEHRGRGHASSLEHRAIFSALYARDGARAAELMRDHIARGSADTLKRFDEQS